MHERQHIQGIPLDFGGEANVRKVERDMGYGEMLQKVIDPNHYLEQAAYEIDVNDAYPVFYSNHNQHLNIAGMHKIVGTLSKRPEDFYVVVAWNLVNGGQDEKLVNFAKGLIPFLEKDNIHLVPIARPSDIADIRNDKAKGRKEAKSALKATKSNIQLLENSLEQNAGLVLFPGATTAEAVKDENGKRPGMNKITGNFMQDIAVAGEAVGRKILYIPIGMVDTNRIIEPRQSNPHKRAKFEIAKDMAMEQLGIDINLINPIAEIVVGEPFYINDASHFKGNEFNDYVMSKVAMLLPESARGEYGDDQLKPKELREGKVKFLGIEY